MPMPAWRQRVAVVHVGMILAVACREPLPPHPTASDPATWTLRAERGDDQTGQAGEETVEPLVASVRDSLGHGVPGVSLTWSVEGGGAIRTEPSVTNAAGEQLMWWTLGAGTAPQSATTVGAIGQSASFHARVHHAPDVPVDELTSLSFDTFDGSGQVVHPDVIGLPYAWDGGRARLAMAITPYPYGNPYIENPSLFVSEDGREWTQPHGAINPVARSRDGYLSDPTVVYNPADHRLWMYYREVVGAENVIHLITSADGVQWDAPRKIVAVPSHGLISPSVVRRGSGEWLMWSINGGLLGCNDPDAYMELRRSADGIEWTAPQRVHLSQSGGFPWHVDVQWIRRRHEYWALYNLKRAGGCVTPALYLATSADGVEWTTYRNPVLQRNATDALKDVVYRSTFLYTAVDDAVTFYFSGARYDGQRYVWSAAMQRRDRQALFAQLTRAPAMQLLPARVGLPNPEEPRRLREHRRLPK